MSSRALIFPGQGSQFSGMGLEIYQNFKEARLVFEEVDDALSQRLSKIIFEGPDDVLTSTANAQPALMTVSMAIFRVLEKNGIQISDFSYVAGHSLGEYTALCAAKSISVSNAGRLLRSRGLAMQKIKSNGKMMAILGADFSVVKQICEEAFCYGTVEVANDNSPGQIVISGVSEALEKVPAIAEKFGIKKCIMLNVSAPFHSSLMQGAADEMREIIETIDFHPPQIPVISNVSVAMEMDPHRIKELLVEQITKPVRWRETLEFFRDHQVEKFYEVGPGKVLAGLAKRTTPEIETISIHSLADIENILKIIH